MRIAGIKQWKSQFCSEPITVKTLEVLPELRKYTVKNYLKYSVWISISLGTQNQFSKFILIVYIMYTNSNFLEHRWT